MNDQAPTYKLPSVGDKLGKYYLTKEIGRGGMALIFEARHETSKRRCALKIMSKVDNNNEFQQRFHRELKIFFLVEK